MMSSELKNHYIELFRQHKFNCFPIPEKRKVADYRYQATNTSPNQVIRDNENYGIIPTIGSGNAIIDFDDKERYRRFTKAMIDKGYMIIESPNGWHMPVIGLSGRISKVELFDYNVQEKKIIEIQGHDHYCVGVESIITDEKRGDVKYSNVGTEKIWNAEGKDFNQFIDDICAQCKVTSRNRASRSSYQYLRKRFLDGEPPLKGSSNDYFHQAAIQCNTDGLSREEAMDKIQVIWHKWSASDQYSGRTWDNIITKVNDVYDNNQTAEKGRPKKKDEEELNRTEIAQSLIVERRLFSNVESHEIFENKNGFLEKINDKLKTDLLAIYPELEQHDYNSILFKLEGMAKPIPETNKALIVFKNGVFDQRIKTTIETDEIADLGFKDYNYLLPTEENRPEKFIKCMFENVPEDEHPRIKIGLRSILRNNLDPRISVIYGESGTGKSTPLLILVEILQDYAMAVELDQLLQDKFIRAKIKGRRLLVLQDLPQIWKDFAQIKVMTGEQKKTERGFMQDSTMFDNKLKIWASGNYLAKIPEHEKNAMYTRRLSLVHNMKKEPYEENPTFIYEVAKEEGEKIVSWILNLPDIECKYESSQIVRNEWEKVASPEIEFLEDNYEISDAMGDTSIMSIVKDFKSKTRKIMDIDQMKKSLENQGYIVKFNIIKNIMPKVKKDPNQRVSSF